MKILSAQQIREADAYTIKEQQLYSHELMERAAQVFSNWFQQHFAFFETIHIYSGTGNNGADGLCVARHLVLSGKKVHVFIVGDITNASADFKLNHSRLLKISNQNITIYNEVEFWKADQADCIIDAIFGTGLNRAPEAKVADIIKHINSSQSFVIAIDMPSGLFADKPTSHDCVEAEMTFAFELPKLCFFFPENNKFIGEWVVKKIGLSEIYITGCETKFHYLTEENIEGLISVRNTFSHKGSYGHALIIAGAPGMTGAAQLCGIACLTAGAGLVTVSSKGDTIEHPELMSAVISELPELIKNDKFNALGIGPGTGSDEDIYTLLQNVLPLIHFPIVIDADALNCIAKNKDLLELLPANSILTPHPKEFERLFGSYTNWDELIDLLSVNAKKYNCIIVYKRAFTIIVTPDGNIYFNSTGNAGMATAGSGDVLTGIITSLLAQKYSSETAALFGVYLHGLAGDLAMMESDGQNLIAGDLINHIQNAYGLVLGV